LSTGFDVTYEHFLEGGGVFSANVFLRKISGITLTKLFQQDGLWVNMPVNAGHAHTTGIELEAKFPLRHWMEDAPAIDLRFNAGFNNSQIDTVPGPNNRLDSQVPARINMGVDYKASSIPLSLGAGFAFQNAGLVRLSPYQTNYANVNRSLDAYALWKFDQSSNLRFAMSNLIHLAGYAENRYVDANGTILRNNWNPSKLAMRINYELRF
jgi:outer membrane receptor protein involved in Fe transport